MNILSQKTIILFILILLISSNRILSQKKDNEIYGAIKCGTHLSIDQKKKFKNKLLNDCNVTFDSNSRMLLQCAYTSKSGKFLIHYDTTGCRAVSTVDKDKNGIPDYVDSVAIYLDYAYTMYVDSMGYNTPVCDSMRGGSNAFDIYICELGCGDTGSTMYGYSEAEIKWEHLNPHGVYVCSEYMVIDNNYSSTDSTINSDGSKFRTFTDTSYMALKVTCCHEFHHVIQDSYSNLTNYNIINELTSTWMEHRLVPESDDFMQYIKTLLYSPELHIFGNGSGQDGYAYSCFGEYVYYYYGDKFLLSTWELIGEGMNPYFAMDSTFKELTKDSLEHTSLPIEFCRFSDWLYYTGSRAIPGKYLWHAEDLPEINCFDKREFDSPSITSTGALQPFEQRAIRFTYPPDNYAMTLIDTLDVMLTNSDLEATTFTNERIKRPYVLSSSDFQENGYTSIDSKYFYYFDAPNGYICNNMKGLISTPITIVYPNPWKAVKDKAINFPAPQNAILYTSIHVSIYSLEMFELYAYDLSVTVDNIYRVAHLDNVPQGLASGVYIYKITYNNSDSFGKFTIIR